MSLKTFPPSEMPSTSSVSDERTPLMRSISALNSSQTSGQLPNVQNLPIVRGHLPSQTRTHSSLFPLVCIIFAVVLERITFYGILANLVLYLINMTKFSQSVSIGIVFAFTGMAWLMSTVGGIIADSYSGRYNAVWGSLLIYIVGVGMMFYSALIAKYSSGSKWAQSVGPITLLALLVISIGEGAYKANITAFGGDQLQGQDETRYRTFFNWYYWSINVASFTAYSAIAYIEQEKTFVLGFGILLACIALAGVIFCICRSHYITHPPSGHILKKMYNIIKEARLKKKEEATRDSSFQYYPGLEENMPIKSWLDRAMMKYGGSYLDTDVLEVKMIGRIMVIFVTLIPYWAIYFQMNSTFLLQGLHMRLSLDANDYNEDVNQAHVVPAWISLVDVIFVLILIPIMDKLVYPWLDKKGCSLSVFTRISTGYLFAVGSMVVAGGVEIARKQDNNCVNQTIAGINYTACMSIYYQIPQYGLIGISEVFASVAALEFAYKEAPKIMQSLVMGLFFFVQSAGSLLGGLLFELCSLGKYSWTPDLFKGSNHHVEVLGNHLDYYFFLLAGLLFVTWIIFLVVRLRLELSFSQSNRKRTLPVIRSQNNLHT